MCLPIRVLEISCVPDLWRAHGNQQVYMTSLADPRAWRWNQPRRRPRSSLTWTTFRGSFGAKHVIPLWRDAAATQPNVTADLLTPVSPTYNGAPVSPELLLPTLTVCWRSRPMSSASGTSLSYRRPRLPITKDAGPVRRVADHGARLLYLHTYGERYGGPHDDGSVPQGVALCTRAVSLEPVPGRLFV